MLACGEFLTVPVPPKPLPERPARDGVELTLPPPQSPEAKKPAAADEAEPRSFLLILLSALGAIHT